MEDKPQKHLRRLQPDKLIFHCQPDHVDCTRPRLVSAWSFIHAYAASSAGYLPKNVSNGFPASVTWRNAAACGEQDKRDRCIVSPSAPSLQRCPFIPARSLAFLLDVHMIVHMSMSTNAVAIESHFRAVDIIDIESLGYFQTTKYFGVAAFTFAILEILHTLPDEITHVWSAGLSPNKVVYFINKYAVLSELCLAGTMVLWTEDPQTCERLFQALAYSYLIGTLVSEATLATRTIALWSPNRYVKVLVVGSYLEFAAFALYCVRQFLVWTQYPPREVLRVTGCVPSAQDRDAWPAFACLIIGETGIITLTILRRYLNNSAEDDYSPESPKRFERQVTRALHRCYSGSTESVLVQTMYRDGIHFYFIFLGITIVNVLVMLFGPEGLASVMQMPLRVVHSALCTRVLLNLRKAAKDVAGSDAWDPDGAAKSKLTTLAFAPGPAASPSRELDWDEADLQGPTVGSSRDSDGGSTLRE